MKKVTLTFVVLAAVCGIGITHYLAANRQLQDQIDAVDASCRQRTDDLTERYTVEIGGLKDYLKKQYGDPE